MDEVIHASPPAIARRIADCFSNTFLDAVIFPAITQVMSFKFLEYGWIGLDWMENVAQDVTEHLNNGIIHILIL